MADEEKDIIINELVTPIEINGSKIVHFQSWKEDGNDYTVYIGECGTVWIKENDEIYEYTCDHERTPDEITSFNQELIDFLKK